MGSVLVVPFECSSCCHTLSQVNEKGTEAAAATAFILVERASIGPRLPKFTADHPFLFLIRHEGTNSVLFLGSLNDVSN